LLFNTFQFGIFFVLVLTLYRALPVARRNTWLLVASLVFYTAWAPAYLLLMLVDVLVNYLLVQAMVRSARPKLYLIASCAFTLGLLAYFKYAALIVQSALPWLDGLFGFDATIPDIFLPLGISFYSFQMIALTVDTYRGEIEPIHSFRRYLLFVSFFPQLIAGPILRGRQFLPQLERGGEMTRARTRRGLWLIGVGLAKKVILADFLMAPFVDEVFKTTAPSESSFYWLGAYSFCFQVYFDFSGYSDMARGMALLMGYELPMNFREPYLSRSPAELWERWHITLSTWLSDYLYIPLGGNRRGTVRTYVNLMFTMLLGGLWHGADWNFVLWGAYHGVFLALHRMVRPGRRDYPDQIQWRDLPSILLVFNLTVVGHSIFRCEGFDHAIHFLGVLFSFESPYAWPWLQTFIVAGTFPLLFLERWLRMRLPAIHSALGEGWRGVALEGILFGLILGVCIMVSGVGGDFIYFQF
jgi:D-alanyl-lipoteichoic acid acyltransferase DltB (MBOAT superfamily)